MPARTSCPVTMSSGARSDAGAHTRQRAAEQRRPEHGAVGGDSGPDASQLDRRDRQLLDDFDAHAVREARARVYRANDPEGRHGGDQRRGV